jgi:hypothetical protein
VTIGAVSHWRTADGLVATLHRDCRRSCRGETPTCVDEGGMIACSDGSRKAAAKGPTAGRQSHARQTLNSALTLLYGIRGSCRNNRS